ncbi:protein indeterminate-domain 7-like [Typha latifolia]|uniref:protein indeterminate-domain 7-like n=1 Tax=Typha latifolia TaxID=4733 RepID=UPI003C2EB600
MSNITEEGGSFSSGTNTGEDEVHDQLQQQLHHQNPFHASSVIAGEGTADPPPPVKKRRNLPGTPDPNAEVIALSPKTLMATNRFVCEICHKGFQRDQNLQLHRRGHNLPWKLRQRTSTEVIRKKVYICPEPSCVHHNPARALGDLTGIKKHYCRKHGEKKWKCDKCSKKYAVQSDWKAHSKTCGTREYKCDCGTIFSRRDSFITHRAFCDALVHETKQLSQPMMATITSSSSLQSQASNLMNENTTTIGIAGFGQDTKSAHLKAIPEAPLTMAGFMLSSHSPRPIPPHSYRDPMGLDVIGESKMGQAVAGSAYLSATALLQKAAELGATASDNTVTPMMQRGRGFGFASVMAGPGRFSGMRPYGAMKAQRECTQMVGFDGGCGLGSRFFDESSMAMGGMGVFSGAAGFFLGDGDGTSKKVTTVDYLGVEGQRSSHEEEQLQRMELEGVIRQQRLEEALNPFQHQMEKTTWDV